MRKQLISPRLRHDCAFAAAHAVTAHLVDNFSHGFAQSDVRPLFDLIYAAVKAAVDKAEELARREEERLGRPGEG